MNADGELGSHQRTSDFIAASTYRSTNSGGSSGGDDGGEMDDRPGKCQLSEEEQGGSKGDHNKKAP